VTLHHRSLPDGRLTSAEDSRIPLACKDWSQIGNRGVLLFLEGHDFPAVPAGNQLAQQQVIERVTRFVPAELTDEGLAQQIQITDRIEDLVLDELILVAETVFVEYAVVADGDGIVHAGTEREIYGYAVPRTHA